MSHSHALILLICIIIGAIAGVITGWFAGESATHIAWLGTLFMNALKMTIIPLIVASIISGIGSLGDIRKLGRIGGYTVSYYLLSTGLAVFIGLLIVNWIQPGVGINVGGVHAPEDILAKQDTGISDIILSLISPNLIASASDTQLLPLIIFAIVFAMALTTLGERSKIAFTLFDSINDAMMTVVIWVMHLAPIGIFALLAARLGAAGGGEHVLAEIKAVGLHETAVLSGLFIHSLLLLLILFVLARRGISYFIDLLRVLFTAFGTASSSATLPLTMEAVKQCGIDTRAVKFVLPLGATVNMNGTALYEAAAAIFIAQAYGIDMSFGQQALIFVTATLAAVGTAGIPEAGLVTMVIVLSAVGLPLDGIGLLLSVDWLLDRFRTGVNVWGDCVGAAIIDRQIKQRRL